MCITLYLQFKFVSAGTALEEVDCVRNIKGFTELVKIKSEDVLNQLRTQITATFIITEESGQIVFTE